MALRYFMWVMKWFFVSVSQRLCGLVSKLLKISPTAMQSLSDNVGLPDDSNKKIYSGF